MKIHFVVHEIFEAPGAYATWAHASGYETTFSRVYRHEPLPTSVTDIDLLVVMGGPQSPDTSTATCPHFDAVAERALIAACVHAGKAVVGVCLGAQLLGEALGAPYEHSPEKEIGVFPIAMTAAGKKHPLFAHFADVLDAGHWHDDMPGLTADATVVAYSAGCPRQIVAYGPLAYGFQCHMEFTSEVIEGLIDATADAFPSLTSHRFVQQPDALRANDCEAMNATLHEFLDGLVEAYRASLVERGKGSGATMRRR